jgi:putative endonuclease
MYTVYILHSERINKYYIGSSSNVQDRLRKHNNASKGFTNTGRPWLLVYTEEFEDKADASTREKQLKKWKSRTRLESLIKAGSEHPDCKSGGS